MELADLMRPIRAFSHVLGAGKDELFDPDERSRQIQLTASIGAVVGLPFALHNLLVSGLIGVGLTELLAVFLLIFPALLLARRRMALDLAEAMVLLAAVAIFGVLIVYRGVQGTGLFWGFLFPFVAFFLKGQRRGWRYSAGYIVLVAMHFFVLRRYLSFAYEYSTSFGVHYLEVLCGFTAVAAGFNLLRTRFEEKLQKRVTERTTEAKTYMEQLQYQATHDVPTGLPNRVELVKRLRLEIEQAASQGHGIAVCNLQVLHLHELGNVLGLAGADKFVLSIAEHLNATVQHRATLARTQRDEFVVIYHLDQLTLEPEALQKYIEQRRLSVEVQGYNLRVDFTFGVSVCPQHASDADVLLRQAEQAMLQARKSELPWVLYDPAQEQAFQRHHLLFGRMCEALDRHQFELYLQPQIDLATGKLIGAEALTRWTDMIEGSISPMVFIPIAEESGLIGPLTDWLVQRCLEECSKWRSEGLLLHLSINISALTLLSPGLVEKFHTSITAFQVPAELINLEITESCFIASPERSLAVMWQLRSLGFKLSIDDFGTGFSSLSYLKSMPIHELKIDQAFVRNLLSEAGDQAIVASTISLAHNLGLKVVAEGIEDEATAYWLAKQQCDIGQGYWFARPMPADAFMALAIRGRQTTEQLHALEQTP